MSIRAHYCAAEVGQHISAQCAEQNCIAYSSSSLCLPGLFVHIALQDIIGQGMLVHYRIRAFLRASLCQPGIFLRMAMSGIIEF